MRKNSLKNRWSVFKENHTTSHICVMIILANALFILCSAGLIAILPENQGHSLGEILRLAFTLMVNPSGKYIYSEAPISLIITTVVVLLGMISLTGGTVGFITSLINGFIEKTANSKRTLKLQDHIVILNYNRRVPAILCDYCFDDDDSTCVVILTNQEKDAVNHQIDEMYKQMGRKKPFKNVIVRTGSPMSSVDLDRIAISEAKTVLLTTPEEVDGSYEEAGFVVSKLFMFVTGYLKDAESGRNVDIIVETRGKDMDDMIRAYSAGNEKQTTIGVEYNRVIGKILGVTVIMPTVNEVLRQLFSFEGVEVYTRPIPNVSIEEELKTSRSVLPLYDMDDFRVYIAEDESEFGKTGAPFAMKKAAPKQTIKPYVQFKKNEIIIVGMNSKLPYILESLSCYKKEYENEELHAILADTADKMGDIQRYYDDPQYADVLMPGAYKPVVIRNIYRPMDDLCTIVDSSADTLLFLSDDEASQAHIDEKPVLYWSDISGRISEYNNPDVVVELCDPENQSIIRRKNRDQVLVSDDFLGRLYAQLGKNPKRLGIIMDLITSEGDTASVGDDGDLVNGGDLMCVKVGTFFKDTKCDLTFSSKRELVCWVYANTEHSVLPIGVAKGGVSYLFSRTENENDGLDSCVLLGMKDGQKYPSDKNTITLEPDDELIFFSFA